MLTKVIKYVDFNGIEREETHYFNLTKAEAIEFQWSESGGIEAVLKRIIEEQDIKQILKYMVEIISRAYGQKSDDGKRFIKSKEIWEEFSQTGAYDELFMELMTDPEAAGAFMKQITPQFDKNEARKSRPAKTPQDHLEAKPARSQE